MTTDLLALDPLTALHLEFGREVRGRELLEWFAQGSTALSGRCAEALARTNVDQLIAGVEGTLVEKLEIQDDVYSRLEQMLEDPAWRDLARRILHASTGLRAHEILRDHRTVLVA